MTEKSRLFRKRRESFPPYVRLSIRAEYLKVTPELRYSAVSKEYTKGETVMFLYHSVV